MAKLYFRYGAMEGGKSTALIQVAFNYEKHGMKVMVVKPSTDTKGNDNVVSRIGLKRKVDVLLKKDDKISNNELENIRCIIVDEAQFLTKEQVKELWIISKLKDIPVICYGLRTDFRTNLFPGAEALFELSDELEELPTICSCGEKARFNARKQNGKFITDGDSILIDGAEENIEYKPLCGKCYIEKVLRLKKK